MTELTVTPEDVAAAQESVINLLTVALVRAQAENATLRRALEGDDAPSPPSS